MKKTKVEEDINTKHIKLDSEKIRDRERKIRSIKIGLLIILLFLIILYFILRVAYEGGDFTVTLDPKFSKESGLVLYESVDTKLERNILKATKVEFMDNISVKWLPNNLDKEKDGSHNGENYLAYTFYVENRGSDSINYWYEMPIDDVVRNVDKAIRIMLFHNGESTIYGRANEITGEPEYGTKKFFSDLEVMVEERKDFKPGEIDKFTVVIYLEGDDPDCVNALMGGAMKMHMDITESHVIS